MSGKRSHVTIDTSSSDPRTTFVEKIHTPHHAAPHADMSVEEWDHERHAHIGSEVTSPHGAVKRQLTPIRPGSGTPFPESDAPEGQTSGASLRPAKRQQQPHEVTPATLVRAVCVSVALVLMLVRL
jgi:hypothetical protein